MRLWVPVFLRIQAGIQTRRPGEGLLNGDAKSRYRRSYNRPSQ
jgi:hypothetical protein